MLSITKDPLWPFSPTGAEACPPSLDWQAVAAKHTEKREYSKNTTVSLCQTSLKSVSIQKTRRKKWNQTKTMQWKAWSSGAPPTDETLTAGMVAFEGVPSSWRGDWLTWVTLLPNIHGGEKAYEGQGWVGKGDRRVKPRNKRQPGRPRLPWTAARTRGC